MDYKQVNPFPDKKVSVSVGHCATDSDRQERFEIPTPQKAGLYEFSFRYGIEDLGLFGETIVV